MDDGSLGDEAPQNNALSFEALGGWGNRSVGVGEEAALVSVSVSSSW